MYFKLHFNLQQYNTGGNANKYMNHKWLYVKVKMLVTLLGLFFIQRDAAGAFFVHVEKTYGI